MMIFPPDAYLPATHRAPQTRELRVRGPPSARSRAGPETSGLRHAAFGRASSRRWAVEHAVHPLPCE